MRGALRAAAAAARSRPPRHPRSHLRGARGRLTSSSLAVRYHMSKHNTVLSSTGSTYVWALFLRSHDVVPAPTLLRARRANATAASHLRHALADARADAQPPLGGARQASTWGKCSLCERSTTLLDPDLPEVHTRSRPA